MVSYAIDGVEDALSATREFLLPFEWSKWWRLAVVAFFVGGAGGANSGASSAGSAGGGTGGFAPGMEPTVPGWVVGLAIAIAVLAVVLALAYGLVSSVMQFVMVESLRTEEVHLRRYFGRWWRRGLRLFGFQVGLALSTALVVAALAGIALAPVLFLDAGLISGLLAVIVVPLLLVVGLGAAVVGGFTLSFVVPVMMAEDLTVLDGWRRFYPVLRREWSEYLAFALVYVGLLILVGVVVGIVVTVAALVLVVPFGLLGLLAFGVFQATPALGTALLVVVGILFFLAMGVLVAFVQVPVVTFFKYYALFVLGDTDEDLDLIPERRAAVREEESGASPAA